MEDNNDVLEVLDGLSEEDSTAFDDAFDEDDFDISEELAEALESQNETEGESEDGQPADEPGADHSEETEQNSEEQGTETEGGNQLFKIKYLGNEEELTLDQITELAQKGRNYDHVVEERDRLKGEAGKYDTFLKELADRAGLSVDEQIDRTRAMWLMNDEFDKGNEISEADALLRVQRQKNETPKEEKAEEASEKTNQMIDRFLAIYPDVKATDIPQEVWESAKQTGDLLGAYQAHEIKRLKAENEKVKQEARNERNSQRSTGPRKTSGSTKPYDDFDAGWDSDD